jgi:hypothetical protein
LRGGGEMIFGAMPLFRSIVYRFPLFHSSYEMRGIVMNASRVRT